MKNEWQKMTLENCGDGALADEFEKGIEKILADLDEDGKLSTDKRNLTLKITIAGDSRDEDFLSLQVESSVKLASRKAHPAIFAMKDGDGIAQKVDVQEELPLNVTPISEEANGE